MTITMIHNQNLTGQHWNTFHLQQKANTWEDPSKAYTPLLALNTGLALRSPGKMLAVVPIAPQLLLCALILTWSVGKKQNTKNVQNTGKRISQDPEKVGTTSL